ncbi:MAG: gamma-glutamyl-gamma-aminobutyrate hydrolase family protein, partial [Pseudobdellovibrionaceae bacterium]
YQAPNETPFAAAQRYLQSVQSSPDLAPFVRKLNLTVFDKFETPKDSQLHSLLIANSYKDHTHAPNRLFNFLEPLQKQNMSGVVLPVGALYQKTKAERKSFYQEVASKVGLLVVMGGHDVDPGLYGQKTNGAVNTNHLRDQLEIEVIQNYDRLSKGKILGVCRGLQITSVALGYKLNQDLERDLRVQEKHEGGTHHQILLQKTDNSILRNSFAGMSAVTVDSHHHQAFDIDSQNLDRRLQIAAISPEGVVEALESRDNRILLLQFHPEKMDMYFQSGQWIFNGLKSWVPRSPMLIARTCRRTHISH